MSALVRIIQAIETSGPGGAEQVLIALCKQLRSAGHQIETLLLKDGWLASRLAGERIPFTIMPLGRAPDRGFVKALRRYLVQTKADILHTHEFTLGVYGRLACRRGGPGQVATAHGANFAAGAKRRLAAGLLLRGGPDLALVTVSENLRRQLARQLRVREEVITVVRNGIVVDALAAPTPRDPGTDLRLLAVGNLYPVKNHSLLIRAVAALRRSGVPVTLDILGRGAEEDRLRQLVARLDVGDSVQLHGFRQDTDEFFSRAHLFVSSSLSEAMPLSFLEAMARGLPVVASDVGGVAEIVHHGVHGLLFPSGELEAARTAIESLARDERLRVDLGRRAAAAVRERFSVERMADRYLGLYAGLQGGPA